MPPAMVAERKDDLERFQQRYSSIDLRIVEFDRIYPFVVAMDGGDQS